MLKISGELNDYVEQNILPQYRLFDRAHSIEHISYVINRSMQLAQLYGTNYDMCYVIAAYHDLGMKYGREGHEQLGAYIAGNDLYLKNYFTGQQMDLICTAIREHRSSYKGDYSSIYSMIIAQADRSFDMELMIVRSLLFGLKNYPEYDYEQQYSRTYKYLTDKYGKEGRVHMVLDFEPDRKEQEKIYKCLESETIFRKEFEKCYQIAGNKIGK